LIRRILVLAFVLLPLSRAEILDRIAITVGRQVITELQLDEELRVTALLNHQPIAHDLQARRAAADRLVEQLLVKHEMELSHYPLPDTDDIEKYLQQVQADFGGETQFDQALTAYNLSENTLRDHLTLQLTTLRFIELRFRPNEGVSETDIQDYYQREIASWRANHPGGTPPALAASKESIRKTLVDARTDEVLSTWLEESRKQVNIIYLDKSLQ
jgi:hypothetical protein